MFSPYAVEVYRSPVETICTNIDYYIPDDKGATKGFSEDAMARLRKILSSFIHFVHEWCHWHRWSRRGNILVASFSWLQHGTLKPFSFIHFPRAKEMPNWQILPLYLTHFPVVHSCASSNFRMTMEPFAVVCVIITEVEKSKKIIICLFSLFFCWASRYGPCYDCPVHHFVLLRLYRLLDRSGRMLASRSRKHHQHGHLDALGL